MVSTFSQVNMRNALRTTRMIPVRPEIFRRANGEPKTLYGMYVLILTGTPVMVRAE